MEGYLTFLILFVLLLFFVAGALFAFFPTRFSDETPTSEDVKIVRLTGILLLAGSLYLSVSSSVWVKKEPLTVEKYYWDTKEKYTAYMSRFDTLKTDNVYWANVADQPEKYCVYKVTGYNMFGMWEGDPYLHITADVPCERKEKFEF